MIEFKIESNSSYLITFKNKIIGRLVALEDGFYQFFPENFVNGSYISYWVLEKILNKLKELNKDWEEHLEKQNF